MTLCRQHRPVFFIVLGVLMSVSQAMPSAVTDSASSSIVASSTSSLLPSSSTAPTASSAVTTTHFEQAAVAVGNVPIEDRGATIKLVEVQVKAAEVQIKSRREDRFAASEPAKQRLVIASADKLIAETSFIEAKTETIKGLWGKTPFLLKLFGGGGAIGCITKGLLWAARDFSLTSVFGGTPDSPDRSATAWAFVNEPVPLCKARCDAARCTDPARSRQALVPNFVPSEIKAVSKIVCAAAVVEEITSDHGLAKCIMTWVQNQIHATHSNGGEFGNGYEL